MLLGTSRWVSDLVTEVNKNKKSFLKAVDFFYTMMYTSHSSKKTKVAQEGKRMKGQVRIHTVMGKEYKVWADFNIRGCFAEDCNGQIKQISGSGYIHNDLTVRKAIANVFGLASFRK